MLIGTSTNNYYRAKLSSSFWEYELIMTFLRLPWPSLVKGLQYMPRILSILSCYAQSDLQMIQYLKYPRNGLRLAKKTCMFFCSCVVCRVSYQHGQSGFRESPKAKAAGWRLRLPEMWFTWTDLTLARRSSSSVSCFRTSSHKVKAKVKKPKTEVPTN